MRFSQGISNLNRVLEGVSQWQMFPVLQLIERLALDKFHGNEIIAIVRGNVVNRDDVRMVQRRSRPGFLHKAFAPLWVAPLVGGQQLERNRPVEMRVERLVGRPPCHLRRASLESGSETGFGQSFRPQD